MAADKIALGKGPHEGEGRLGRRSAVVGDGVAMEGQDRDRQDARRGQHVVTDGGGKSPRRRPSKASAKEPERRPLSCGGEGSQLAQTEARAASATGQAKQRAFEHSNPLKNMGLCYLRASIAFEMRVRICQISCRQRLLNSSSTAVVSWCNLVRCLAKDREL
jgi:hypothetical protein